MIIHDSRTGKSERIYPEELELLELGRRKTWHDLHDRKSHATAEDSADTKRISKAPAPCSSPDPIMVSAATEAEFSAKTEPPITSSASLRSGAPFQTKAYELFIAICDRLPTTNLASIVSTICPSTKSAEGKVVPYADVRERFIAASVVLNERGELAPRFRNIGRTQHKALTPAEQLFGSDLQVIDLHWLYCHGKPVTASGVKDVFSVSGFRFDLAWDYARVKAKAKMKADYLGLGTFDENCLFVIQREDTRQLWHNMQRSHGGVVRTIKDRLDRTSSRRQDDAEVLLDTYKAYMASNGVHHVAEKLFCLMGHPKPTRSQFKRRVDWLLEAEVLPPK